MDYSLFIKQLEELIQTYKVLRQNSKLNDLSDLPKSTRQSLVTRGIAAVNRITGDNSTYSHEISRILKIYPDLRYHTSSIMGVVQAVREDLNSGYLQNLTELVHGEIFSDFLDMADHLCENGYKDPAAVLAGSTLESHLRKLADKNSILNTSNGKPIKADKINSDLQKANVYSLLDQKNITAWLDLRNKAAHGDYTLYNSEQVKLLISSIRDFITRNPA